jgi:three-Cys-motif partner protein
MATPKDTVWQIEPHTTAKHKILDRYLKAWFPILSTYNGRIIYLDGFSGPGIYEGGEPGSPIIALKIAKHHRLPLKGELVFIFVDDRPDRISNLEKEISKLSLPAHFNIRPRVGEFRIVVGEILDQLDATKRVLAPTFAFVDPFGFSGVPFDLLNRLLKHPRSEAFITFMVDAMNRFLESPSEDIRKHIVEFFGTEEVLQVVNRQGDRKKNLLQFYEERLRTLARFVRVFEMCNKDNRSIYYLVFVTNNPLGHLKMKEAMWKVDSEGDFRYSDATNPQQAVLFQADHSERLFTILERGFSRKTCTVRELREFVRNHTEYIDKHLSQALAFGVHLSMIDVEPIKLDGRKRIENTYPDDVVLTFK